MGNNPIRRSSLPVDPLHFIPEGVDELVYIDDEGLMDSDEYSDENSEYADVFMDEDSGVYDEDGDADIDYVPTPDITGVIEQVIRTTATGSQVIDLYLNVENVMPGAEPEFKVAKR